MSLASVSECYKMTLLSCCLKSGGDLSTQHVATFLVQTNLFPSLYSRLTFWPCKFYGLDVAGVKFLCGLSSLQFLWTLFSCLQLNADKSPFQRTFVNQVISMHK